MARKFNSTQAKKLEIVHEIFDDKDDMMKQIHKFSKDYANLSNARHDVHRTKENLYYNLIQRLKTKPVKMFDMKKLAKL